MKHMPNGFMISTDSDAVKKARRSAFKAKTSLPCVSCLAYGSRCKQGRPCSRCTKLSKECVPAVSSVDKSMGSNDYRANYVQANEEIMTHNPSSFREPSWSSAAIIGPSQVANAQMYLPVVDTMRTFAMASSTTPSSAWPAVFHGHENIFSTIITSGNPHSWVATSASRIATRPTDATVNATLDNSKAIFSAAGGSGGEVMASVGLSFETGLSAAERIRVHQLVHKDSEVEPH